LITGRRWLESGPKVVEGKTRALQESHLANRDQFGYPRAELNIHALQLREVADDPSGDVSE
jgi:hypothetical protein